MTRYEFYDAIEWAKKQSPPAIKDICEFAAYEGTEEGAESALNGTWLERFWKWATSKEIEGQSTYYGEEGR